MEDDADPNTTSRSRSRENPRDSRVGSVVRGKYRLETFLATGTMAKVYAATHRNGSRVALKILHRHLSLDPSLRERFKREGYFANTIGHPGVVRAIDDDVTEDDCPFLVMELLEGETLESMRHREGGKLSVTSVLPVADSLLDVLAAAHAHEIVHRDLKPDNVFITAKGDVKVLDFGVARFNDGKTSSDMTAIGMVLGTPAYMPPEQALGKREEVNAQSDIWAVGATLFVVLSGQSVHQGGDARAKLIATARTPARALQDVAPEIPEPIARVIDRALAFHKRERWNDATSMREALRDAAHPLESVAHSSSGRTRSEADGSPEPPPVPTRRTLDRSPAIARAFSSSALADSLPRDDDPTSNDFLTSAPPLPPAPPRISTVPPPPVAVVATALDPSTTVRLPRRDAGQPSPPPPPADPRASWPAPRPITGPPPPVQGFMRPQFSVPMPPAYPAPTPSTYPLLRPLPPPQAHGRAPSAPSIPKRGWGVPIVGLIVLVALAAGATFGIRWVRTLRAKARVHALAPPAASEQGRVPSPPNSVVAPPESAASAPSSLSDPPGASASAAASDEIGTEAKHSKSRKKRGPRPHDPGTEGETF